MRPVRIITAVVFAAAMAVTGCAAHSTAVNPPVTPVVDAPAPPAPSPTPKPIPVPVPAPKPPILADGQSRDTAQYLSTYVRNQNPRLHTLALAGNLRVDLLGGDCEAPLGHKLSELAAHARSDVYHYYYALTVTGGAVQRIQELRTGNAC